jgi:hypothetical protein
MCSKSIEKEVPEKFPKNPEKLAKVKNYELFKKKFYFI